MKNILYILQQSIYNNDGKWLTADSNIQMMRGMLFELTKKTDWKFNILIGSISDFADIKDYKEIFDHPSVKFIAYDFPVDAFLNRQTFDAIHFRNFLKYFMDVDIIWNNIPEISRNIKTVQKSINHKAKLISCCYFLDCPEIGEGKVDPSISIDWRQFDGFECSDLTVFTCESTRRAFYDNAILKFNRSYVDKIMNNSSIWDFGYSIKELSSFKTDVHFPIVTILFLNRLSGTNYTHHKEFIDSIKELYKTRKDFQVCLTNPSQKSSWEYLESEIPNLKIIKKDPLNRDEYINLLHSSHISVHLFTEERYGGCAHRESVECENIIICPMVYEYKRIHGNDYPFYVDPEMNPQNIAAQISKAIDFVKKNGKLDPSIYFRNGLSSFEVISNSVIKDILSC